MEREKEQDEILHPSDQEQAARENIVNQEQQEWFEGIAEQDLDALADKIIAKFGGDQESVG